MASTNELRDEMLDFAERVVRIGRDEEVVDAFLTIKSPESRLAWHMAVFLKPKAARDFLLRFSAESYRIQLQGTALSFTGSLTDEEKEAFTVIARFFQVCRVAPSIAAAHASIVGVLKAKPRKFGNSRAELFSRSFVSIINVMKNITNTAMGVITFEHTMHAGVAKGVISVEQAKSLAVLFQHGFANDGVITTDVQDKIDVKPTFKSMEANVRDLESTFVKQKKLIEARERGVKSLLDKVKELKSENERLLREAQAAAELDPPETKTQPVSSAVDEGLPRPVCRDVHELEMRIRELNLDMREVQVASSEKVQLLRHKLMDCERREKDAVKRAEVAESYVDATKNYLKARRKEDNDVIKVKRHASKLRTELNELCTVVRKLKHDKKTMRDAVGAFCIAYFASDHKDEVVSMFGSRFESM